MWHLVKKRIEKNYILQIAAAENGGVHPDAVHSVEQQICAEAAYHRAAAMLAFLDNNSREAPMRSAAVLVFSKAMGFGLILHARSGMTESRMMKRVPEASA